MEQLELELDNAFSGNEGDDFEAKFKEAAPQILQALRIYLLECEIIDI